MKFELTLRGFNGETDHTDHLVLWVEADMSVDELKAALRTQGLWEAGGVVSEVDSLDIEFGTMDFELPEGLERLGDRIRKLVEVTESGNTLYKCECGYVGCIDDLDGIKDIHERVAPGEFMAAGCCPDCGQMFSIADVDIPDYTLESAVAILERRGWRVQKPDSPASDEGVPAPHGASVNFSYLDLSTGHLSEATMDWLNEATPARSHCSGLTIAPYEFGAFVSVPGESEAIDELECADDLKAVLRYARGINCDVLRFDSDGSTVSGLPRFNW